MATRRQRLIVAVVAIGLVVLGGTAFGVAEMRGGGSSSAGGTPTPSPAPTPSPPVGPPGPHVLVIMEENSSYEEIVGSPLTPYINSLANKYALATQWYALKHGSVANYIATTSGQLPPTTQITNQCTPGQGGDLPCTTSAPSIVDQLEARGLTWKAYQEDMPTPCFREYSSGKYVARHNPFIYYSQIRDNPVRCNRIVPFTQLAKDLIANALPSFAWITPNLCNDMHNACPGGRIENGDRWLQQQLPYILGSGWFRDGGVVVITWDESEDVDTSGCCGGVIGGHIPTLVLSHDTSGFKWDQPGDLYGILRGLEELFNLPFLGAAANKVHGDLGAVM
jgi:hypothetical protein